MQFLASQLVKTIFAAALMMNFKSIGISANKSKIGYYAKSLVRQVIPTWLYQRSLKKKLLSVSKYDKVYLKDRVNYYNKLAGFTSLNNGVALKDVPIFKSPKTYNFDLFEYMRYFKQTLKIKYLAGDVNHVEDMPTIQKSRPLTINNNANAVLLKLDKKRHFVFVKDPFKFSQKKDMLIGRGAVTQPHRIRFMEQYFDNPLCNLGQVNKYGGNLKWLKPKISILKHLEYKFILSLEGNDVATNLKWIMSSNSIAVMPLPKYETWFMEGRLIPDHHYILIKDDYSDLEEKLRYYITNADEACAIVNNANNYIKPFLNKQQENLIAFLVLQKYFYHTSQINESSI